MRFSARRAQAASALLLALLAASARHAAGACNTTLALPATAGSLAAGDALEGWCAPFAIDADSSEAAVCSNLSVPAGGVLQFGTCALPGAACSGSTALELRSAAGDSTLAFVGRVALDSAVARLSQGCVLGVRCSFGEWRNVGLAPAPVAVRQSCFGRSACAGVAAWRVTADATLLPALQPAATDALVFTVSATAAQPLALLALVGEAPTSASMQVFALTSSVALSGGSGGGAATAALATTSGWTLLWSGTWSNAGASFGTPLAIPAGGVATLLVRVVAGGGSTLPCAHALGTAGASPLISDALLSVSQGAAVASPLVAGATVRSACAWRGLSLTYATPGVACAPPPPPPAPAIATSAPSTLVASLDDLLRALAEPDVALIEVNAHIVLNGTQLSVALPPSSGFRALTVEGTNACWDAGQEASQRVPCALDGGGASRIFSVGAGVQLRLAHLQLLNGAPVGGYGGCVLADGAAPLRLDDVTLSNCSAPQGGGGVAVLGGDVAAVGSVFEECSSGVGGGLLVAGGGVSLTSCAFRGNEARALARAVDALLGGPPGAVGGGAALFAVTGALRRCDFTANAATTVDMVLLANPDASGQARGGGLYASKSALVASGCTWSRNAAGFGGGVNANAGALTLQACALTDNVATLGFGGGVFTRDCPSVAVLASLLAGNAAGGRTGGGIAAFNSTLRVSGSTLRNNAAPTGCGGALGLDVNAALLLDGATVLANNTARDGGGACCELCASMALQDSYMIENEAGAGGSGGALYSSASPTVLSNMTLRDNAAPTGGAIAAYASPLSLADCVLERNAAQGTHGGAVLHDASDDPAGAPLALRRCRLAGNFAEAGGGALAVLAAADASLAGSSFEGNTASGDAAAGGALWALDVRVLGITGCRFAANTVTLVAQNRTQLGYGSAPVAAASGAGGGAWLGANLGNCSVAIDGSVFADNAAPSGGGVYATGDIALLISGSSFQRCAAAGDAAEGGMTSRLRSGAALPVSVTLYDGFAQKVRDWRDTSATIETDASITGLLRTFYAKGAATFSGLTLKGAEGATYTLTLTVSGPDLFGSGDNSRSVTRSVSVQPCEPDEAFDAVLELCACATGFGLVVESSTCERCTNDSVVPVAGGSCVACPALSQPASLFSCVCQPGYFGTIEGATGGCTQCPADTYRGVSDPPNTCVSCPLTSHTFALGGS